MLNEIFIRLPGVKVKQQLPLAYTPSEQGNETKKPRTSGTLGGSESECFNQKYI